jgi:hypothetical protein
MATRWEEANCRPQDSICNCHKHGNLDVFRDRLEAEHPGITEWLLEQSRQVVKNTRTDLKHILLMYRAKLTVVERKIK